MHRPSSCRRGGGWWIEDSGWRRCYCAVSHDELSREWGCDMGKTKKKWLGSALLIASCFCCTSPRFGTRFDLAAWQAEDAVFRGRKLAMADRLVLNRTLLGKAPAEVVEILGEPCDEFGFGSIDEERIVYSLQRYRSWIGTRESAILVLELGPDGLVVKSRVRRLKRDRC